MTAEIWTATIGLAIASGALILSGFQELRHRRETRQSKRSTEARLEAVRRDLVRNVAAQTGAAHRFDRLISQWDHPPHPSLRNLHVLEVNKPDATQWKTQRELYASLEPDVDEQREMAKFFEHLDTAIGCFHQFCHEYRDRPLDGPTPPAAYQLILRMHGELLKCVVGGRALVEKYGDDVARKATKGLE